MTNAQKEAFDFGKKFLDLVREARVKKHGFDALAQAIKEYTGLNDSDSLTLAKRVLKSDRNATALCAANRRLSHNELVTLVGEKDMTGFARSIS